MREIRIAAIDDDLLFEKRVERVVKRIFQSKRWPVELKCFASGEALLGEIEEEKVYDVYLLDVEIPRISGFQLAKEIRREAKDAVLLFISSHEELAIDSFAYAPLYFVRKEELEEKLPELLSSVYERLREEEKTYYIIENERKWQKIKHSEILFIDKEGKNTKLHCTDVRIFQVRKTLQEVYEDLPQENFIFINRGVIVNLEQVMEISRQEMVLTGGEVLPISKYLLSDVKKRVMEYYRSL